MSADREPVMTAKTFNAVSKRQISGGRDVAAPVLGSVVLTHLLSAYTDALAALLKSVPCEYPLACTIVDGEGKKTVLNIGTAFRREDTYI